jgi:hypothetical protein
MSDIEDAFAVGFAELHEALGKPAWTYGGASLDVISSRPIDQDPNLPGGSDKRLELRVLTKHMPANRPKDGTTIMEGTAVRIVRGTPEDDRSSGITKIIVSFV